MNWPRVWTALVTPFFEGRLDEKSFRNLVQDQLNKGIRGFVVTGSTGESFSLDSSEKKSLYTWIRQDLPSDATWMAGVGDVSLQRVEENFRLAEECLAPSTLIVVPPYVKPTQAGLKEFFFVLEDKFPRTPKLLYNVPSRTVGELSVNTIVHLLSQSKTYFGIKEATGDLTKAQQILSQVSDSRLLFSGDDETSFEFRRRGGYGVISVASHCFPEIFLSNQETPSHIEKIRSLYVESNPIPVKYVLFRKGILRSPELRLPLTILSEENQKNLNLWIE